ncbi:MULTISPECIES: amino acid synthesis family protein [Azospirillaceae]|uniref:amino acid synthesis family protein n=1 Tax=Azospirillaceae TaxID=2829815 RepID=UPI000B67E681|nr:MULTISPECIES: amino acid synthesis family protein [Azospirillaceae]MDG5493837.1 amino acid synthesis family protein [Niveispirillum sp. BGYR6]SNS66148.1 Amino acid synthesis [Azospirillum sp. RU38E]SNS84376.1 Amino acid synthesis [Azospirillum sp. RU37A]
MVSRPANFNGLHIRKWYSFEEETLALESGRLADGDPVVKIVVAAAIHNPHAGTWTDSFETVIKESAALGVEFGRRLVTALNGRKAESYGKSCIVGVNGEYEHGNAFLTTDFANPIRDALGGALAWVPSTGKRGGPGTEIDIPLAHKDALYVRSHYDTMSVIFPDAPGPDEVLIAMVVATRGRLHARLGGIKVAEIEGKDGLR